MYGAPPIDSYAWINITADAALTATANKSIFAYGIDINTTAYHVPGVKIKMTAWDIAQFYENKKNLKFPAIWALYLDTWYIKMLLTLPCLLMLVFALMFKVY